MAYRNADKIPPELREAMAVPGALLIYQPVRNPNGMPRGSVVNDNPGFWACLVRPGKRAATQLRSQRHFKDLGTATGWVERQLIAGGLGDGAWSRRVNVGA